MFSRAAGGGASSVCASAIYNSGNHDAIELETFISELERLLGVRRSGIRAAATGDVPVDLRVDRETRRGHWVRAVDVVACRARQFVQWYREYYGEGESA